jgi:hypothetical protein
MARGFDQFLANRLTSGHVVEVVVDPKLADAIFTDRIGEALTDALDEIAPALLAAPPSEKDKEASAAKKEQVLETRIENPAARSTLGRPTGAWFLVDAKTRKILWSTFDQPKDSRADQLDRLAFEVAARLKQDLTSESHPAP